MCDVLFSISVGKDEKKKEKKEDSEKTVRDNIRKSLKEILTTRYGIHYKRLHGNCVLSGDFSTNWCLTMNGNNKILVLSLG